MSKKSGITKFLLFILSAGLIITAINLIGGIVSSYNDHRIAMSAAIASVRCKDTVTIIGADAVNKSYPDFWNDITTLGADVTLKY